jgi:RES domain-containing protein
MSVFFRIVQQQWAASAMTGEGARLYGGRWNPPGMPAVYLAESRALAALEILVHAPREAMRLAWRIIEVELPDASIEIAKPADLPGDWRDLPSSPGARRFGGEWLRQGISPALCLPSAVIPEERSLMVNPLHPDFIRLRFSKPRVFRFDPRFQAVT